MLEKAKNIVKFFFGIPLTIISLYFIFNFIYTSRNEIIPHLGNINLLPFITGIIFLLLFFLLRSLAWKSILDREGYSIDTVKSTYLLAAAEIKRYIPGSVLGFISRVNSFGTFGIRSRTIIKMILYESIIFVFSSIVVSIPGILYISSHKIEIPSIYYVAVSFFIILLLSLTIAFFLRTYKKYTGNISSFISKITEFKRAFFLMFFGWIFFGIGNYLIAVSFYYLDPSRFLELSSFFVLSWLIGYMVIIVPLGLGVREAAIVIGLSSMVPTSFAAALSILLRLGLVASELIFLLLAFILHKYKNLRIKLSYEVVVLWSSIASYIFYFSYLSIQKHLNFFTGRFDLGNMDQTIWNSLHGNFFQLTNPHGTETISRLAVHADFILIFLTPFYLVWEDPRMLLIIQSSVLGIGAYIVYKIGKHFLQDKSFIPLAFSISYLLNPWVQKQNLFDFHAVTLATTFLLAAWFFMLKERYKYFLLFLILAVLTKENVYLVGVLFGFSAFLKTKNRAWLVLSAVCGLSFYILISKLIPAARGEMHFALEYFGEFGSSVGDILKNLFFNPTLTMSKLFSIDSFSYAVKLLLPLGFLSILSLPVLVFAAPDLLINLLSSNENLRNITFHYAAVIIPFTYIAAIYSTKKLISIRYLRIDHKILSLFIILMALYSTYQYGVLPGAKNPTLETYTRYLPERKLIKGFLDSIPQDLSVSASNNIGAHLSHRKDIYVAPIGVGNADLIVLLLNDDYAIPSLLEQRTLSLELQNNPKFVELYRVGDFVAFARREIAHRINSPY